VTDYYRCAEVYYRMMRDLGIQVRETFREFIVNAVLTYLGYKDADVVIGTDGRHAVRFAEYLDAAMLDMYY